MIQAGGQSYLYTLKWTLTDSDEKIRFRKSGVMETRLMIHVIPEMIRSSLDLFIYYLFIYTYNDIHKMKVAINVEVTMIMKEDTIERR